MNKIVQYFMVIIVIIIFLTFAKIETRLINDWMTRSTDHVDSMRRHFGFPETFIYGLTGHHEAPFTRFHFKGDIGLRGPASIWGH